MVVLEVQIILNYGKKKQKKTPFIKVYWINCEFFSKNYIKYSHLAECEIPLLLSSRK